MRIEYKTFTETEHYKLFVEHIIVEKYGTRQFFIDCNIMHGQINESNKNIKQIDLFYDTCMGCQKDLNDFIIFMISVANYTPLDIEYGTSNKQWLKFFDILVRSGVVEIKTEKLRNELSRMLKKYKFEDEFKDFS